MGVDSSEADGGVTRKRRSNLKLLVAIAALVALTFATLEWRKHAINSDVQTALVGETGADTNVYRRNLVGGNDLVFDVASVDLNISMADMTRRLLKSAEALKDRRFNRVYLASHGHEKFYLEGEYFQNIGQTRLTENPVYTARTLPENVHKLDGSPAFQTWSGGLLGVVGAQLDDFQKFHRDWWVDEALAVAGSK